MPESTTEYRTFHFPTAGLRELQITGFGTTDDGDDAVVLSGDIVLVTDDILVLAAALQGLAIGITTLYVEAYGTEDLVAKMTQIEAEATGQSPLPFPDAVGEVDEVAAARLRHPSAPDIQGRDI